MFCETVIVGGVVAYESGPKSCTEAGINVYIIADHHLALFSSVAGVKLGLLHLKLTALDRWQ